MAMAGRYEELESNVQHLRRFALALTRNRDRADDLVQDTLERAISRWVLRKPGLPLRPWLFAILRNLHISGHRKGLRLVAAEHLDVDEIGRQDRTAEGRLELAKVLDLLASLPDEQRMAILLVSVEGFSYAEAARIMEIPVGTVMSRLNRGRKRLRELVETPPEKSQAQRLRRVK
jgi:RNA polymerase sigma-70 factor, ECF subfamily